MVRAIAIAIITSGPEVPMASSFQCVRKFDDCDFGDSVAFETNLGDNSRFF